MDVFGDAFTKSFDLIISFDRDLIEILYLSAKVSLLSLLISCIIGFPLGAFLAICKFPFRNIVIACLNSLMGLPPVVVGLIVYLYLSRSGPFGFLGLLYTPSAMIIAQSILIIPIIGSLSCQILEDLDEEYKDLFKSFVVNRTQAITAYLYDARYSLFTVVLAGFGRAVSEVGAVIIDTQHPFWLRCKTNHTLGNFNEMRIVIEALMKYKNDEIEWDVKETLEKYRNLLHKTWV